LVFQHLVAHKKKWQEQIMEDSAQPQQVHLQQALVVVQQLEQDRLTQHRQQALAEAALEAHLNQQRLHSAAQANPCQFNPNNQNYKDK
jgi:hypothetical protein